MGFTLVRCRSAFIATVNGDLEAAMKWLLAHMEDPDIDDSIAIPNGGPEPSAEQVGMLSDMGFSRVQAHKAWPPRTQSNTERAIEWLFSHPDDMCDDEQPLPVSSSSAEAGSRHDGAAAAVSLQKSSDPF
ncbi:UBA-like protein [Lactarius pseudohatsudake]|nr:UBA-like protein [Lactarius pseudohatsudake]